MLYSSSTRGNGSKSASGRKGRERVQKSIPKMPPYQNKKKTISWFFLLLPPSPAPKNIGKCMGLSRSIDASYALRMMITPAALVTTTTATATITTTTILFFRKLPL